MNKFMVFSSCNTFNTFKTRPLLFAIPVSITDVLHVHGQANLLKMIVYWCDISANHLLSCLYYIFVIYHMHLHSNHDQVWCSLIKNYTNYIKYETSLIWNCFYRYTSEYLIPHCVYCQPQKSNMQTYLSDLMAIFYKDCIQKVRIFNIVDFESFWYLNLHLLETKVISICHRPCNLTKVYTVGWPTFRFHLDVLIILHDYWEYQKWKMDYSS